MVVADNKKYVLAFLIGMTGTALSLFSSPVEAFHEKAVQVATTNDNLCESKSFLCNQTITSAFDLNGQLWRVWSYKQRIYWDKSIDGGNTFSQPKIVATVNEKISARGENRIKIAFDNFNGVYLSWATPRQKRFTADVRFSYSSDGGENFSSPVTVNDDNLLAGHSFNEMHVTADGDVNIVWLDGRHKAKAKAAGRKIGKNGSSLYKASANPRGGNTNFNNKSLAENTCQCCRIAISENANNELAVFWRQIFETNTREFALLTVKEDSSIIQVSFDEWKIDGCPHQGGSLSIDEKNRYHMVWFNQGNKGKGIFYSQSDDEGNNLSAAIPFGNNTHQAVHPHLKHTADRVDIVWLESSGKNKQLWHVRSNDRGSHFSKPLMIAESSSTTDRPFLISHGEQVLVSWLQHRKVHSIIAL